MSKVVKGIVGIGAIIVGVVTGNPALIKAGIALTASAAGDLLASKPKFRAAPITANTAGGVDTLPLAFGSCRLGGKIVIPATVSDEFGEHSEDAGSDGVTESYFVAIAHTIASPKGVESLGDVYLDGRLISSGDIDVNGWVTDADWLDDDNHPMVQIIDHLGTSGQTVDSLLDANVTGWGSNHRLRGIAYTVARFVRPQGEKSEARFQEVFSGRVPEVSRAGSWNPCYDPRLDTTRGGSGSHRADDSTTWEWSDNPALIAATYMLMAETDFGMEVDPDLIDWTTVAAAATICDETFDTPSGALAKYRFNGTLDSPNPDENLSHIADAMAGVIVYDPFRGTWVMFAGEYDAPSETIDETWLRGSIEYNSKTEIGSLYNACKVNYVQPSLDYEPTTSLLVTNSTYETQDDGQQLTRELNIPGIDHEFRAQRRALIEINRSREQRILSLPCNMKALGLNFWDTVTVDFDTDSVVNGVYRIIEYTWGEDGLPDLLLLQANDDTYDSVSGDYTSRTFPAAPDRPNETPPTPKNLSLTATPEGILARIDPLGRHAYDLFEWQISTASDFSSTEDTIESPDSQLIFRVTTTNTRYVRVRAKKGAKYSGYSTSANVTPDPASLGATDGATAGTNLYDSADELLEDKDVRNDLIVQAALSAYNANPSFEISRAKVSGVLKPASWWASENGTTFNYVNTTTRDVVFVGDGGCIANAAFVPNANTQYEFSALVRADTGTVNVVLRAEEYNSDLPSGKRAVGFQETESQVQVRDNLITVATGSSIGTSFTLVSGVYTPSRDAKWTSMTIRPNSGDARIEWAVVRELSTRSFAFDNVIRNPGAENGSFTPHTFTTNGGTWLISSNARSGAWSFRYDPAGQTGNAILFFNGAQDDISGTHAPTSEGEAWYLHGFMERGGSGSKSVRLRLQWKDEDGAAVGSTKQTSDISLTTSFTKYRLVGVAPAGAAYVVASILVLNDGGTANVYGDDFYLRRVVGTTLGSGLSVGGLVSGFNVNPITGWTDVGSNARINIQASTLTIGEHSISYPSGSVSGLAFNTKYHIYRDDPELDGGGTYAATTSLTTAVSGEGRVYFGTFTTGADGGGGGSPGGPGACVEVGQWVGRIKCSDLKVGDLVHAMNDAGEYLGLMPILAIEDPRPEPCVRIATAKGCGIVSTSTPVTTGILQCVWSLYLRPGSDLIARLENGRIVWEPIRYVKKFGTGDRMRHVRRISVGGHSFLHGDSPDLKKQIFTHNPAKP